MGNIILMLVSFFLWVYCIMDIISIYVRRAWYNSEGEKFLSFKFLIVFNKFKRIYCDFEEWIYSTIAKKLKQNKILEGRLLWLFNKLFFDHSCSVQFVVMPPQFWKFVIFRLINSQKYKIIVKISKFIVSFFRIFVLILGIIEIYILGEIRHPFLYLGAFMLTYFHVILIQSLKEYFKLDFFIEAYNIFDRVSIQRLIKNVAIPTQYLVNFLFCPIEYKIKLKLNYVILKMDPHLRFLLSNKTKKDRYYYYKDSRKQVRNKTYKILFKKEKVKNLQNFYQYSYCGYQICKFIDMETSDFLHRYFIYPIKFLEIFVIIGILCPSTMISI